VTPADHLREAEAELEAVCEHACPHSGCVHEAAHIARAQAHALAAAVQYLSGIRAYLGDIATDVEALRGKS